MRIVIETGECRNEDAGDWLEDNDGTIQIRVAPMPFESAVFVGIHELIEFVRCKQDRITDKQVTDFDAMFLQEQKSGLHPSDVEPGADKRAPYFKQHADAELIERMSCAVCNLSWQEHCRHVNSAI